MDSLEKAKENMYNQLYSQTQVINDVKKINYEKLIQALNTLLRECLKNHVYIVDIENYTIDLDPNYLSVKYDSNNTYITYDETGSYEETNYGLNREYFIIDTRNYEDCSTNKPYILVDNILSKVDNDVYLKRYIEICNSDNNIEQYLNPNKKIFVDTPQRALAILEINKYEQKHDSIELFNKEKVFKAYLKDDKFIESPKEIDYSHKDYKTFIPNNDDKIKICETIYNYMKEMYKNFYE